MVVVRRTGPVQALLTTAEYLPIKLTVPFGVAHGEAKAWSGLNPFLRFKSIQGPRHDMLITVKHG